MHLLVLDIREPPVGDRERNPTIFDAKDGDPRLTHRFSLHKQWQQPSPHTAAKRSSPLPPLLLLPPPAIGRLIGHFGPEGPAPGWPHVRACDAPVHRSDSTSSVVDAISGVPACPASATIAPAHRALVRVVPVLALWATAGLWSIPDGVIKIV